MKSARNLTEGAMLLAVFSVLLLITVYVPVFSIVLNLFLPVPFILFAARNEGKWTVVFVIASVLLSLIVGAVIAFPLALQYGATGAVIGFLIRKKKDRITILMAGFSVFLVIIIGIYGVSIVFFKFDIINDLIKTMQESLKESGNLLRNMGQQQEADRAIEQFNKGLSLLKTLIPSIFVIISLTTVFIIQLISVPILKRFGIQVQKWKPFKDLSLPRSIVWYLLIVFTVNMFVKPDEGTYLFAAVQNVELLLRYLMIFQGYTLMFYYFDLKGVSKPVSIFLAIFTFFIPIFHGIIWLLGIIDLGFDLRKRFEKKA